MNDSILIVFVKNPRLGKVKTRLAKTIGQEKALKIYHKLLKHTEATISQLSCDIALYFSDGIENDAPWNKSHYKKNIQSGKDLGERMQSAFRDQFQNHYNQVVIIGSDLWDLNPTILEEAFNELSSHDVVVGPAKDGGYYLLGLNDMQPALFKNKSWSTPEVLEQTLLDLQNQNVKLLNTLNDIDTFEDLKSHPKLLNELESL